MPPFRQHFPSSYGLACYELDVSYQLYERKTTIHGFFHKCNERDETWFWNMFAKPVEGAVQRQQLFGGRRLGRARSSLERLPTELIDHIIDSLVDEYSIPWKTRHDVLALGLSSLYLYPIVVAYIQRGQAQQRPASFFAMKKVGFYDVSCTKSMRELYHIQNRSPFEGRVSSYCFPSLPDQQWSQSIAEIRKNWNVLNERQWVQLENDVSNMHLYPQDRVWVLRNFTTRQIVRSDALTPPAGIVPKEAVLAKATPKQNWVQRLLKVSETFRGSAADESPSFSEHLAPTLAQVFLIRVVRASVDTMLPSDLKLNFQHGIWAGHAFDVVTLDEDAADTEGQWADVSALAAADVGHLRWCVGQAEIAKTWPEHEEKFWDDIIWRGRQKWRHDAEGALRDVAS